LLVLRGGVCIAARRGGEIEFHAEDLDERQRQAIRELLDSPRRRSWSLPPPAAHAPSLAAVPAAASAATSPSTAMSTATSTATSATTATVPAKTATPPPATVEGTKSRRIRDRWSSF
jgi:hypothetical protein